MAKLSAFVFTSLNGYLSGPDGSIGWHRHGPEEKAFAAESLRRGNTLLFGRKTYDLMAGYWPTPQAIAADPVVAEGMNKAEKIVFSRTLGRPVWNNTSVVADNITEEVRRLKHRHGKDMTILGSGSIVSQLAERGMIDEYQIMVDPVALPEGMPLFHGIARSFDLKLIATRAFQSGAVLLTYQPLE